MPDTRFDHLPILRDLRDDLAAAYAAREAAAPAPHGGPGHHVPRQIPGPQAQLGARRRRVARGRRVTHRIAAVAAAAAFAAVLVTLPGDGQSAASVLEAAAVTAAAQPVPAAAPGTYAYFRERDAVAYDDPAPSESGGSTEWWVAADGSGRVRDTMRIDDDFERPVNDPGAPRWRRAGAHRWVRSGRFGTGEFGAMHRRIAPGALSPRIDRLPTAPAALETALTRQLHAAARDADSESGFRGPVQQYQLLIAITQTLAHPLASPELRSALYRVAATIDDVTVTAGATDPAGRPAAVLVHSRETDPGTVRTEIFFDRETAAVLARRTTTSEGSTFTDTRIYTPPTTVDSTKTRP